jgi:transposase, IS30 family
VASSNATRYAGLSDEVCGHGDRPGVPVAGPSVLAVMTTLDGRSVVVAVFNDRMVPERVQPFWAALQRGEFITDAAAEVGTYRKKGTRWVAAAGGVRPRRGRDLKGCRLTFSEREEIALARARGESMRCIARRLGRSPSTVSRELRRNADRRGGGYRATTAHALAHDRASRPKPAKLATNWRCAPRSSRI